MKPQKRIILIFLLAAVMGCAKPYIVYNNKKVFYAKSHNACKVLRLLADTSFLQSKAITQKQFISLVNTMWKKSDIRPNMQCGFVGCGYMNLSLDKSVYKLDLIRWMKYFNCPDTTRLQLSTKGNFNDYELKVIHDKNINELRLDTMLLYPR